MVTKESNIRRFCLAGINHKKADAAINGGFSINRTQYKNIITLAPEYGIAELFVLSTCGRTEMYAIADEPYQLIELLMSQTTVSVDTFISVGYTAQGVEAARHLFTVCAATDSELTGDCEIITRLKVAVDYAKERGAIGVFFQRLVNAILTVTRTTETPALNAGIKPGFTLINSLPVITIQNVAKKNSVTISETNHTGCVYIDAMNNFLNSSRN